MKLLTLFLLLQSVAPADIQKPLLSSSQALFDKNFDNFLYRLLDQWHTPGLAIAVVDGNETYSKGYGVEEYPDTPVTPSTLFYTASTTKSFTAAALSLLIDDTTNSSDPLTWQSPLANHLRADFVLQDEYLTDHITVEDAASHRTGQPDHIFSWAFTDGSLRDVVRKLRHLPPSAEIRTKWQYCNMMFVTLSSLIEKVTGSWLGDFLRSRIYEPLNMTSTFFSLSDAKAAVAAGNTSLARGYTWDNATKAYISLPHVDKLNISGAGATISNVLDYAKWVRCLMTQAPPLSLAGHIALRQPRITMPQFFPGTGFSDFNFYALGLMVSFYRGELLIWHTGGVLGFGTIMAFLPDRQWGVVIMANNVEGGGIAIQTLAFKLIDDMLGIPSARRDDWEAWFGEEIDKASYILGHAQQIHYPHTPDPLLPLAIPLSEYAGLYTHPAYPALNLTLSEAVNTVAGANGTGRQPHLQSQSYLHFEGALITFEHVSGDFFLAYIGPNASKAPKEGEQDALDPWLDHVMKAEFRVGEDGRIKEVGIAMEPQLGETKVWWRKVH